MRNIIKMIIIITNIAIFKGIIGTNQHAIPKTIIIIDKTKSSKLNTPHLNNKTYLNNGEKAWCHKFLASDEPNFATKPLKGVITAKATESGLEKNIFCPIVAVIPKDKAKLNAISEEEFPSLNP